MSRLGIFMAFILITVIAIQVDGKGGGGRGGGGRSGGGRSSGGRGGGGGRSFGGGAKSYSGTRSAAYSRGVGRTTKFKTATAFSPSVKSNMKKAAIFSGGAYIGHKASSKIGGKFKNKVWVIPNVGHRWDFNDWEQSAARDGFLCRSKDDCTWLDPDLECSSNGTDYINTITPGAAWFGGDAMNITGQCQCEENFWWDNDDLQCQLFTINSAGGLAWWEILLIVIGTLLTLCCCCSPFFLKD